jgi:2-polyprenyl-3-methyl-5-hydroxy-6-metoxy-1,4-benzoquinol methylase
MQALPAGLMKHDPVTSFRDQPEAAADAAAGAPSAPFLERRRAPRTSAAASPILLPRPGAYRPTPVDLENVGSARSLAVLAIPPHSAVLDVGCGPGDVARALAARRCRVWAIDIDPAAARIAEPWCERVVIGDVETADLDAVSGGQCFDAIVCLDVLVELHNPAAVIRRLLPLLTPGGRLVLSVPDVADGSGRPRPIGDHPSLERLLRDAGARLIDEARVNRPLAASTVSADAESFDLLVIVTARRADDVLDRLPTLVSTLTERLHRVERHTRRLQQRAQEIEEHDRRHRAEHARLQRSLHEAREEGRRQSDTITALTDDLRRSDEERRGLEDELERTNSELRRCQIEWRFLREDVIVKDTYLATLRDRSVQQAAEHQRLQECVHSLSNRLDAETRERAATAAALDAERRRAVDLAGANQALEERIDLAARELHRVHTAIAETLAQRRYVLAERLNGWARKAGFLHRIVKRAWSARSRGE